VALALQALGSFAASAKAGAAAHAARGGSGYGCGGGSCGGGGEAAGKSGSAEERHLSPFPAALGTLGAADAAAAVDGTDGAGVARWRPEEAEVGRLLMLASEQVLTRTYPLILLP
jgi:hypothetical protein